MSFVISVSMSYFICKPGQGTAIYTDKGFSRRDVVIEGKIFNEHQIKVIAPQDTVEKWPVVKADYFVECEGPARPLDHIEYSQLIHRMCLDNAD